MSVCVESGRDPSQSASPVWLGAVGLVFWRDRVKLWWKRGGKGSGGGVVAWWRGLCFFAVKMASAVVLPSARACDGPVRGAYGDFIVFYG